MIAWVRRSNRPKWSPVPWAVFLLALAWSPVLGAQQEGRQREFSPPSIYRGPIRVERLSGSIDLQDGRVPASHLRVQLAGAEGESAFEIGFRGGEPRRVSPREGREALIELVPRVDFNGVRGGAQQVEVDLTLQIDGEAISVPVGEVDVLVRLPEGVPALIRSNHPVERRGDTSSEYVYRARNHLPTPLRLVYTAGPSTITIRQTIDPAQISRAGTVRVTLEARNEGPRDARGIELVASYDSRDFEAEGPDFERIRGEPGVPNDTRLVWRHQIDGLRAGEATTITYTIRAKGPVRSTHLDSTTASIDGRLVGVGNVVSLNR